MDACSSRIHASMFGLAHNVTSSGVEIDPDRPVSCSMSAFGGRATRRCLARLIGWLTWWWMPARSMALLRTLAPPRRL